jgi:hypothetical protein
MVGTIPGHFGLLRFFKSASKQKIVPVQNLFSNRCKRNHFFFDRCDIYPTDPVIGIILLFSIVYNSPRFFDSTIDFREDYSLARVNNTGIPMVDQQLVTVNKQN